MPSIDRRQAHRLVLQLLELPVEERPAALAASCDDEALRDTVQRVLRKAEAPSSSVDPGSARSERLWTGFAENAAERETPMAAGKRLGPYRVLGEIGRGGMAVVYRAERVDGEFARQVALKILKLGFDSEEVVRRFEQEQQILASLEHPNIARLYDAGRTEDGRPYFVMELVEGVPIDRHCDEWRLSVEERLELFCVVTRAVEYAHQNLVVHRDLKPSNILVNEAGEVKLLDFGIARLLDMEVGAVAAAPPTRAMVRMITPEYASPEQVRGERVTTASDVYQLGLLLYELLTGRRAYALPAWGAGAIERVICEETPTRPSTAVGREETLKRPTSVSAGVDRQTGAEQPQRSQSGKAERATAEAICQARRTTPTRLRRRLHGDLDNITLKALRKEPEHRYGSADRLAQDIRRHLEGLPVTARADTWVYRGRKFLQRHAAGAGAAAAVLVLAAGFAGLYTMRVQSERDRAQAEAAKARQVSEFLAGLFRSADPREARGSDVAARRELLDEGVERVDRELAGQPEVRADMLHVLGRTYLELGVYDSAHELLTRSLRLHRERFGPAHPEVAEALHDLGLLRFRQGAYEEARVRLERARRIFAAAPESGAAGLVDVLSVLGQVYHTLGAYEESRTTLERALAVQRRMPAGRSEALASILHNTGIVLFEMGDLERSEHLYEEALPIYERELGEDHPQVGYLLMDLANTRMMLGEIEELDATYRRSLAIQRQAYGAVHVEVGLALTNFGHYLTTVGRDREAVEVLERALAILRATVGADHPMVAYPLVNLGDAHRTGTRLREARSLYRESVEHRQRAAGDRRLEFDPLLAHSLVWLGRVEGRLDNGAAAARLQNRALAIWRRAPETLTVQLAPALREFGAWMVETRRCADAAPMLRRALALERTRRPVLSSQVAELEGLLASCETEPAVPGRTGQ